MWCKINMRLVGNSLGSFFMIIICIQMAFDLSVSEQGWTPSSPPCLDLFILYIMYRYFD